MSYEKKFYLILIASFALFISGIYQWKIIIKNYATYSSMKLSFKTLVYIKEFPERWKEKCKVFEKKLSSLPKKIIAISQQEEFFRLLVNLSSTNFVDIVVMQPKQNNLTVAVHLVLHGKYKNILKFIDEVLQTKYIVTVESLRLEKDNQSPYLLCDLNLSTKWEKDDE